MRDNEKRILAINSGSSSIKFSIYNMADPIELVVYGKLDRIGLSSGTFQVKDSKGAILTDEGLNLPDHRTALKRLLEWLKKEDRISAVGHRIVHGGPEFKKVHLINEELIGMLKNLIAFAPEHLPHQIMAIETLRSAFPGLPAVACFDTAFHATMPEVARIYPIPGIYREEGVLRYGFHGLSYEYVVIELNKAGKNGKTIIAHLGNGASMCAVMDGKSVDTTMGFTPAGGLIMSRRSGDLDPGVIIYLLKRGLNADEVNDLINHRAGLLGVSGISSDMKELLAMEKEDQRAKEAIDLFCYQAKKFIGALAASMGGLDTLVFTAGVGENSPAIRERICASMAFLGIELDPERNLRNEAVISARKSRVTVMVIRTDEELMMARHTRNVIAQG